LPTMKMLCTLQSSGWTTEMNGIHALEKRATSASVGEDCVESETVTRVGYITLLIK